ncbi:MAG: lipoate--protein ligase [Prolixibacteraceae bacterium]|nr:lipoate--protein ligase [Prolixibacteraceae bacterium]MBN2772972.1 lipoate--protein ligase [Prolixibacteraceae bacterium]
MLCIRLKNTNPYYCLAAEEYLLKNFSDDIFILWQSHNTVVVGKHQNLLGEVNYPYCMNNNITIARRISGGGTVFHDRGNVNFTYIKNVNSPAEISFKMFTQPIVETLAKLGVKAETSGSNDLLIDGKKISGNAEHIYKNRVLHHGTLLFDSDLVNLGKAIKVVPGKYTSKAVQSNRSVVTNISSFLKEKIEIEEFISFLFSNQLQEAENSEYILNDSDHSEIEKFIREKFTTWDWIYGYSPTYSFQNKIQIEGKRFEVEVNVKKGIIQECRILGNYFNISQKNKLKNELPGKRHDFQSIRQCVNQINLGTDQKIIESFF